MLNEGPFRSLSLEISPSFSSPDHIIASVSQLLGILSLSIWLFAQLPQIIENHLNHSVAGVSLLFLSCWILGDITNLVGCILTGALPFQTCLAAYYCFIDLILSFQYWYYTQRYPKQKVHHNLLQSPNMLRPTRSKHRTPKQLNFDDVAGPLDIEERGRRKSFMQKVLSYSVLASSLKLADAYPVNTGDQTHPVSSNLVNVAPVMSFFVLFSKQSIGEVSAWLCSALYLSSRAPQIVKNHRSGSTEGISVFLFTFTLLGNTFYTISILADLFLLRHNPDPSIAFDDIAWAQLPFLVGSTGTIMFDLIILFQFWYFKPQKSQKSPSLFNHDLHMHQQLEEESPRRTERSLFSQIWLDTDEQDSDAMSFYTNHYNTYSHDAKAKRGRPDENTSLLHSHMTPPPPNYISTSSPYHHSHQKPTFMSNISALAKSLSRTSSYNHLRSPLFHSPSHNGIVQSIPVSKSPPMDTSLIPSIVGTYSSISKKMMDDSKIPFLPIDFLHDDAHSDVKSSK